MESVRACFRGIRFACFSAIAALLLIACIGRAQEMPPGPQKTDQQSPASDASAPDSASPQAPASPSSAPAPAAPETAPAQFDASIFQKPLPSDQLTFLSGLSDQPSGVAIQDKQYRKLLRSVLPDCMFHYGYDMSPFDAFDRVIDGSQQPVEIRDGRYVMVSGSNGPYLAGRGFIWIDTQTGIALAGFYFHPTNGEPTPTVTILSKQVKQKSLEMNQLPAAFAEDLNDWAAANRVPTVTTRYFITGANEKILLAHDEDYCAPSTAANSPDENDCEQMNADAADDDMNAAYYLEQVHHATNATAWMIIDDDQKIWIGVRDDTCNTIADPLPCRIRMTHDRTRVILNREPRPHPPPHR